MHRGGCEHRALTRLYLRAAEHGFSEDDVLLAVAAPQQTYTCPADRYGPDRRMYQRARVAVVVDELLGTVVTLLPRVQDCGRMRPPQPHAEEGGH